MGRLALVYVRQSDPRPGERSVSMDVQEEACCELPAVKACDEISKLRDAGISGGSTTRRTAFLKLLETIRNQKVDVVAFYDQSRAFRNTKDALEFRSLVEALPIEIVLVHGQFDRTPVGGFSFTLIAAAHEFERKTVSQKTSDALRYKVSKGLMVGPVPVGYIRVGGEVLVDPVWSETVARIFKLYATGSYSTRELARKLNAEGGLPPTWKGGAKQDSLAQLLRHPAYIGRAIQDQSIVGKWQPIIEPELWHHVQSVLSRNKAGGRGASTVARSYAFRGLLVCADCGQKLHAHTSNPGKYNSHAYYLCRPTGAEHDCGQSIREDRLLPFGRAVLEWLEQSPRNSSVAPAVKEGLTTHRNSPNVTAASIAGQIDRLNWRFDNGYAGEDEYKEKMVFLKAQLDEASKPQPVKMVLTGLVQAWDSGNNNTRRALLLNMFDELVVSHGKLVDWRPRAEVAEELAELLQGFPFKAYRKLVSAAVG